MHGALTRTSTAPTPQFQRLGTAKIAFDVALKANNSSHLFVYLTSPTTSGILRLLLHPKLGGMIGDDVN
jgi:hypothetical protein